MENAADALKMAGAVLLFVMALSICIFSFSKARESTDLILSYQDEYRESDYAYIQNNGNTQRNVGLETIIPTLYRAYKENYKVVFDFSDEYYLFEDEKNNKINIIDLETTTKVANDKDARDFIDGVLYQKFDGTNKNSFQNHYNGIKLNNTPLYNKLKSSTSIEEKLGVYYQEETEKSKQPNEGNVENSDVPNSNKTEKRIITYKVRF